MLFCLGCLHFESVGEWNAASSTNLVMLKWWILCLYAYLKYFIKSRKKILMLLFIQCVLFIQTNWRRTFYYLNVAACCFLNHHHNRSLWSMRFSSIQGTLDLTFWTQSSRNCSLRWREHVQESKFEIRLYSVNEYKLIWVSNVSFLFLRYGFVIAVTTIDNIGAGVIQPGRGFVLYPVKYKAIVFRPFKGEVVDAVVTQVNKVRAHFIFS